MVSLLSIEKFSDLVLSRILGKGGQIQIKCLGANGKHSMSGRDIQFRYLHNMKLQIALILDQTKK